MIFTIETLKKKNPVFFSVKTKKMHGDESYELLKRDGVQILRVKMSKGRVANYEVTEKGILKYVNL